MDSQRLLQEFDLHDDDLAIGPARNRHRQIRSLRGLFIPNHNTLHALSLLVIAILAFSPLYNRAKWQKSCITRQSIYCSSSLGICVLWQESLKSLNASRQLLCLTFSMTTTRLGSSMAHFEITRRTKVHQMLMSTRHGLTCSCVRPAPPI